MTNTISDGLLERAIAFYETSPDGQYDREAVSALRELQQARLSLTAREKPKYSAIRLMLDGDWWIVALEDDNGKWVQLIREHKDSAAASHIIEPSGIQSALEKARG